MKKNYDRKLNQQVGFSVLGVLIILCSFSFIAMYVIWFTNSRTNNTKAGTTQKSLPTTSETGTKMFTFTAAGDFTSNENADKVLRKMATTNPDFILALGDLSYDKKGTETAWCNFVRERIGSVTPFEIIAGNHDDGHDLKTADIRGFTACLPHKIDNISGDYGVEYSFDYQDLARFIMISPDISGYGDAYSKNGTHYKWVEDQIDAARTKKLKWVILGMHKNCITPGQKSCEIGEDLLNLALSKNVDLILQGHEHAYFRSKQLSLSPKCPAITINATNRDCIVNDAEKLIAGMGSVIVISGAGGAELRPTNPNDPESGYFASINTTDHGFSQFDVTPSTLSVRFIRTNSSYYGDSFSLNTPTSQ